MADKEYLLGNRARELLKYTHQATKTVSSDVSQRDVRKLLEKIASLDDLQEMKDACRSTIGVIDKTDKQGFTKATYRCYGEEMRIVARQIVADVHAANCKMFSEEYDERLVLIRKVLDGCSLLLEYIQICLDLGIIDIHRSEIWTKKVTDVKNMTLSWKKSDGSRANKLRTDKRVEEDRHLSEIVENAVRKVNTDIRR